MKVYAIIPARSGSKGLPNKNIKKLAGKELMAYSIEFALKLKCVDKVICSTDSEKYAEIAIKYGAEVPFLRSGFASSDTAMEADILQDLDNNFSKFGIPKPNIIVWLRPTFVFRDRQAVELCVDRLITDDELSSCRIICEAESRLYVTHEDLLSPHFDDYGCSMVRRQDVQKAYKVFSTDVFRFDPGKINSNFLGDRVGFVTTNKICGLDIDDIIDFYIVELLILHKEELVREYMP